MIDVEADEIGQQAGAIVASLSAGSLQKTPSAFVNLPTRLVVGASS